LTERAIDIGETLAKGDAYACLSAAVRRHALALSERYDQPHEHPARMLAPPSSQLQRLPLHAWHLSHGARLAPFAQYQMPVSYPDGVLKEHLHTRAAASLFDVSHMGQLVLRPEGGTTMQQVALALERLLPIDVASLKPGRQRYGFLTTDTGGIRDDLMIANLGRYFLLIVNAGAKDADHRYLRERLAHLWPIQTLADRVLFALQGPRAAEVLTSIAPGTARMRFLDAAEHIMQGVSCWVMRSGYTGEDGFEISAPREAAQFIADELLADPLVHLAGLGARDTLRLEAGLCLYGADIDPGTTPVQAALEWAIPAVRRPGGARAGGFPGAQVILTQLRTGTELKRVGLRSAHQPVRAGALLYPDESGQEPTGRVTSGGFGPSVGGPVAMGYVPNELARTGQKLFADVRGRRIPVTVTPLPFVPHCYQR
jgi:aminomethyltransferase